MFCNTLETCSNVRIKIKKVKFQRTRCTKSENNFLKDTAVFDSDYESACFAESESLLTLKKYSGLPFYQAHKVYHPFGWV
jgi:hypothetical protein